MTLVSVPLTPKLLEVQMQLVTMAVLGLDPTQGQSAKAVRIGWQPEGQPAFTIDEDVVFVRCVEEDDEYNRIRDQQVTDDPDDDTLVDLTETYTRVWRTYWTIYGPNSFDRARAIRSAMFSQSIHDLLLSVVNTFGTLPFGSGGFGGSAAALYFVTDPSSPRRVPELFDGQWWERVDWDCRFNEGTVETDVVNAVKSTEVIIEKVKIVPCP